MSSSYEFSNKVGGGGVGLDDYSYQEKKPKIIFYSENNIIISNLDIKINSSNSRNNKNIDNMFILLKININNIV